MLNRFFCRNPEASVCKVTSGLFLLKTMMVLDASHFGREFTGPVIKAFPWYVCCIIFYEAARQLEAIAAPTESAEDNDIEAGMLMHPLSV